MTERVGNRLGVRIWNLAGGDDKLRSGLAQVERNAQQFSDHYCVASTFPAQQDPSIPVVQQLWTDIAALQISYGRRLATMYCDSVDSLGRGRLHLAALGLRAFLELTGALLVFEQRITKRLLAGVGEQQELEEVNQLLRVGILGGRFHWAPFAQGGGAMDQLVTDYAKAKKDEDEPTQDVRQKSTAAFVAELEKVFARHWPEHKGKVRVLYAVLSDICHPSLGGDLLFVDLSQSVGVVKHRAEPHDEMLRDFVRRIALPILLDVSQLTVWSLKRLGQVADSLHEDRRPSDQEPPSEG